MKILHISQPLAAGVGQYLAQTIAAQIAAGHAVVLAHAVSNDTPSEAVLNERYAGLSRRVVVPLVNAISPWQDGLGVLALMRLLRQEKPDVIHLHSSKAGIIGRVAARLSGVRAAVFYSPHGFAFLREDVSPWKQRWFLRLEQWAAKLGGSLVACSATEAALAKTVVCHPRVAFIENAVELDAVPQTAGIAADEVLVLNAARACYQKAPWRFKVVADQCADLSAKFVWIGAGDREADLGPNFAQNASGSTVLVTGWLTQERVFDYLQQGGVFLMPSLWEGMPLALIEAQAAGLPAVVSNVVGCKDVVIDGVTGFVCDDDASLVARTRQLIADPDLRATMSRNAIEMVRPRFLAQRLNDELLALYSRGSAV